MIDDVLVVAEHRAGEFRAVTFELVGAAAAHANGTVHVAVIAPSPDDLVDALDLAAIDEIHCFAHPGPFSHDVTVQVIRQLARRIEPSLLLGGHTAIGLDTVPAIAEQLAWPLVTDIKALVTEDDRPTVTRERFGSKVEATLAIERLPAVMTLRPGAWAPAAAPGTPSVHRSAIDIDPTAVKTTVTDVTAAARGDVDITEADVIVSVGRGIGEEENLHLIEDLATCLDATIAASRPIVDAGWLPKNRQVGQSGHSVAPSVYLAIGISGAVQHVAGIQGADTIVAINDDPDAPIFEVADVGIVDDLFAVVPALIEALEDE